MAYPELTKKPYKGTYPSVASMLIKEGVIGLPRQSEPDLLWADTVDITYPLKKMTPSNFQKYSDLLLLLALQEGERYKEHEYKFARFEVRISRKAGADVPEVATFQAAMHHDTNSMVYGPGYEVPTHDTLKDKVDDILQMTKRYQGKINQQKPYVVTHLVISIRNRKEAYIKFQSLSPRLNAVQKHEMFNRLIEINRKA